MARKKQGSIVKKGNKYYAVVAIGSKRKWIKGGDTVKDAQRVLSENLFAVDNGTFKDIKKTTFREFGKIWLDSYVQSNIKETAHYQYTFVVNRLTEYFGDALLQNIAGTHIQGFINKRLKEIKASTTQIETILLKQMLKYAYDMGYIKINPCERIKNPRKPKEDRDIEQSILAMSEVEKLLDKMHFHYRIAALTAIETGLRANELWGLTWNDIDFNDNVIRVRHSLWRGRLYEPKTKTSKRNIDISPTLALKLKEWKLGCHKNEMNIVFPSREGHPVNHNNFSRGYFKKALKQTELKPVTWHSLRHTNASIRIMANQNPKYISEQLGHSSIKITFDLYGHLFKKDEEFTRSQVTKLENVFYVR
jgi:integrase